CTLTVAKDNNLYPLPYSEETVRQTSKGYSLPCVLFKRQKEKYIETEKEVNGCFITLLTALNIAFLFKLINKLEDTFDIYTDRICETTLYKNLTIRSFELRAYNCKCYFLKIELKHGNETYVTSWPVAMPLLKPVKARLYYFDGHKVFCNNKNIPLIYHFELTCAIEENYKYVLTLYFPLNTIFYPVNSRIEKLSLPIDETDNANLVINDLQPLSDLCDINSTDTVLVFQKYAVLGSIDFTIRNKKQFLEIKL
nr:hypothetical protein [Treponema sp.]